MAPNELAVRHGVGHAKCMVPTLSQPLAAFALSAACAYHVQRCLPPFVLHVDIGLSVDGQLHHLQVAILRGDVDDGVAVARVLQQKLDRDTVTFNVSALKEPSASHVQLMHNVSQRHCCLSMAIRTWHQEDSSTHLHIGGVWMLFQQLLHLI